ncbi:MAG: hypothetical protein ACLTF6_15820 [Clostridium sp.]
MIERPKRPGTRTRRKTSHGEDNRKNRAAQARKSSKTVDMTKHRQSTGTGTRRMTGPIRILSGFWQVQVLLAAIVVVAVLIVVFSKARRFLQSRKRNPGKFPDREQPGRSRGTGLKGHGGRHAVRTWDFLRTWQRVRLRSSSLTMKRTYEYFDDV